MVESSFCNGGNYLHMCWELSAVVVFFLVSHSCASTLQAHYQRHQTVHLARDTSNFWEDQAIRVENIEYPIELVGYLEHAVPCFLRGLLDRFVPEIAPAELHGVINVPCRIDIYSGKTDFETVKSAITSGGMQFLSSSVDNKQKGVDHSSAKRKPMVHLGTDCRIFHNKASIDVWKESCHDSQHCEFCSSACF